MTRCCLIFLEQLSPSISHTFYQTSSKSTKMKSLVCLFVFSLISSSLAYIITVDSHSEECFFDNAQAGVKLGKLIKLYFHYL